ncbi:MAG: hypothetical protein K0R34_264 [Herbinix sp.]|jgi:hypothetical protein|nr:hypothetical protein [Herbinix sp.]
MKKYRLRKKNKFLYQGYKESKMTHDAKGIPRDSRVKKLKRIRSSKITQTIVVACLDNECGCTYITQALANYIKAKVNNKILIIDKASENGTNNSQRIAYQLDQYGSQNQDYKYVISDMGNLKERSDSEKLAYKKASIKIMISNTEDDYLKRLAAFVKEDKKSSMKSTYIFNLVPQDKKKKVHRLMEAYEHYCLPIIDKDNLSYEAMKIFNDILSRKRGN